MTNNSASALFLPPQNVSYSCNGSPQTARALQAGAGPSSFAVRVMNKRDLDHARAPALVPLFGGHDKKPRTLERDVMSVGRARGCDVILEAPDVSTLHCLVYRTPEGFRIRDCGSRTGTRVNGTAVRNHLLHDEDVVQVGPFSFKFRDPERAGRARERRPERERLEQARRNLTRLALTWRRRCRDLLSHPQGDRVDLKRHEAELKARIRAYDNRANQLEEAERELDEERRRLGRERDEQQERVQKVEQELGRRLEDVEKDVQKRWAEFQARCTVEEHRLDDWSRRLQDEAQRLEVDRAEAARGAPAGLEPVSLPGLETDELRRQLTAAQEELTQGRERMRHERDELSREREDIMQMRERWTAQESETATFLERQRQALQEAEAALKEQRLELSRMMSELRDLQQAIRAQQQVDVPALQKENEELRALALEWRERAAALEKAQAPEDAVLGQLRALAAEEEQKAQAAAVEAARAEAGRAREEADELRRHLSALEKTLAERDRQPQEPGRGVDRTKTPSSAAVDLETYENELNQYRKQIETDRARLNGELEQLRQKNAELDEATREMEMELSRERAELARERIRLDRLREEVRAENERMQRDAGMRESLAPVQKLREQLNGKKAPADNRVSDRLRSFRNPQE